MLILILLFNIIAFSGMIFTISNMDKCDKFKLPNK